MRPLSELEVPRDLAGLAFDVDDTITQGGELMPCALEAMQKVRASGLRLVAVTGRPLGWAEVLARLLPVDAAIGENGAGWFYRHEGQAREGYIHSEDERRSHVALHQRIRARVSAEMPAIREASDARLRRYDLAFDIGEETEVPKEEQRKLEEIIRDEGALPVTSSVHCHASTGTWDKAKGIAAAGDAIWADFDAKRWIFIGDSGNDAAAFAAFPLSVGVANVREHRLTTEPRFVTPSFRGEGFAELCSHIFEALDRNE